MSDKFIIDGKSYPVPADLTLGEACVIEQEFGVDIQAFEEGKGGLAFLAAFTWIAMHRVDDAVTPKDVKALNFSDIDLSADATSGGEDEEVPPISGGASDTTSRTGPSLEMIRAASGSRVS